MENTALTESPHKICCSCGLEIREGEGHATHEGKHWHYGDCTISIQSKEFDSLRQERITVYEEVAERVYSPKHYTQGYLETIYVIRQVLGEQGFKDFCMGNYIKYRERQEFKNGGEDLKKAEQYLEWATNGLPEPVDGRVPR